MHTESIKPPRALWVPFEFGRPFGPPNRPDLQTDVLRRALALFERPSGPVIEDFEATEEDIAGSADAEGTEGWSCPLPTPPQKAAESETEAREHALLSEVSFLKPWYEERLRAGKRTAFGLSGLSSDAVDEIATFLVRLAQGEDPELPSGTEAEMPSVLRFLAHDLKTFYIESAMSRPAAATPSSREIDRWLFTETRLAGVFYDIRERFTDIPEATRLLIPRDFAKRPGKEG